MGSGPLGSAHLPIRKAHMHRLPGPRQEKMETISNLVSARVRPVAIGLTLPALRPSAYVVGFHPAGMPDHGKR